MKIKKYFAKDMRKALNMARDEQGPEVVIISNRRVVGGVELLAAENYDESLFDTTVSSVAETSEMPDTRSQEAIVMQGRERQGRERQGRERQGRESAINTSVTEVYSGAQNDRKIWTDDSVLERMQDEIHSLRKLLEQQMSGLAWGQIGRSHPVWAGLLRRFAQLGISPAIAKTLVEQIPQNMDMEKAWRMSLAFLSYRIKTSDDNLLTPGNVLAFVGSSGVGKTTTIAKLATTIAMEGDVENLILATTDSYRIGGRDHLRSYAKILGVPVYSINNSVEFKKLLDKYQSHKTILIDTAGLSPIDNNHGEQIQMLASEVDRIKICLVLSASTQASTGLDHSGNIYKHLKADLSMITKLDEADSIGGLLSFLVEKDITIAYACDGQKVPDDLQRAEAHKLIARAVSRFKQQKTNMGEEELEQIYGKYAVAEPFGE